MNSSTADFRGQSTVPKKRFNPSISLLNIGLIEGAAHHDLCVGHLLQRTHFRQEQSHAVRLIFKIFFSVPSNFHYQKPGKTRYTRMASEPIHSFL